MNFLRLASPIFAHGRSSNLPLRAKTKERRRKKKLCLVLMQTHA